MVEIKADDLRNEVKDLFDIKLRAYKDNIKHYRDKDKDLVKKFKDDRVRLQNIAQLVNTLIELYIKKTEQDLKK